MRKKLFWAQLYGKIFGQLWSHWSLKAKTGVDEENRGLKKARPKTSLDLNWRTISARSQYWSHIKKLVHFNHYFLSLISKQSSF